MSDTNKNKGIITEEITEDTITEDTFTEDTITEDAITEDTFTEDTTEEEPITEDVTTESAVNTETGLELASMTKKERKLAKKQKYLETTKDMSPFEKFQYIFMYYKWYFIVPIAAVFFLIYLGNTIYKNSIPVTLNYVILNIEDEAAIDRSFEADYSEIFKIEGKHRYIASLSYNIDYEYFLENKNYVTSSNSTDYNILSLECEYGDHDVIITNQAGLTYCSSQRIARPLRQYFSANTYDILEEYMHDSLNPQGIVEAYALDISNTDFAKNLNLNYTDVYLIFPGTTEENKSNAYQLVEYIFNVELNQLSVEPQ